MGVRLGPAAGWPVPRLIRFPSMFRSQPLLFQPVPSNVACSLTALVEEVRASYFPELGEQIEVRIAAERPLAYIDPNFMGVGKHLLVFHAVLNHRETPLEVLRFIAKHELTHLVRPPRMVGRAWEAHPPEFWEHEAAVGPERYAVWAWVQCNLGGCLRRGEQGIRVTGKWRALREATRIPYTPSLPFEGERWEQVCPDGGAQLRLPPDWPVRPLPIGR